MTEPGTSLKRSGYSSASAAVLTVIVFALACTARATWRRLDPGFIPESVVSAPTNPQRLIATTSWGATATSLDGGHTWLAGLPVLAGSGSVVFDGVDENTLYRTDWAGVWRSVDGGATWELRCGPILSFFMASLHNDSAAPSELFLTVDGDANYRSADGGATWARVSAFAGWVFTVPGCASLFTSSIDNTLRESIDGGRTWTVISSGLPRWNNFVGLAVDPVNPARRWTAFADSFFPGGIFETTDGGATWTPLANDLPSGSNLGGLVLDASRANVLFVTTWSPVVTSVYRSSDGGTTWRPDLRGIPGTDQGPAGFYRPQTAPLPYLRTSTGAWAVVRETRFYPLFPCRLVDTRTGGTPLSPSAPRRIPVTGVCGIPHDAVSVAANLTIVDATAAGGLAVSGEDPLPNKAGTVGMPFRAARVRATGIVPELGPEGDLWLATIEPFSGSVHVVVDVSGYFR